MKKYLILIFLALALIVTAHAKILQIGEGIDIGLQIGGGPGVSLYSGLVGPSGEPPDGFSWVVDSEGNYIIDAIGSFVITTTP